MSGDGIGTCVHVREVFLSAVLDVECFVTVFGGVCCFTEPAEGEDQPGRDPIWDAHEGHWDQAVPSAHSTASAAVCHYTCAPEA